MPDLASLIAAVAAAPDLPLAACKGEYGLMESSDPDDIADAEAICARCPELDACLRYWLSLPPRQRPTDCVIAGAWRPAPLPRKRVAA